MQREQLQSALGKGGLQNIVPDIEKILLPSIRIKTRPADESSLPADSLSRTGASKIGGTPDLPAQAEWPAWKGKPQSFIAQIDLAQASKYDEQKLLPDSGTLLFFYDADQQTFGDDPADRGGWKVMYAAKGTALSRRPAPDSLKIRFKANVAEFSTEFTLPQDVSLYDLHWAKDDYNRYSKFAARLPLDRGQPHHRMLGHPDQIQDEMRSQAERLSRHLNAEPPHQASLNWLLLLQVDSDENIGMRWASTGMLYFWIERQALQARNFENVWLVLQSE